jgi:hypothetical protein
MSENGHYSPDIITTEDEEGKIHLFEKVDELEIEGQRYALLIYQGSGEELENEEEKEEGYDEEIVVMRVSTEDDAEVYEAIEDEEEFERVVQYIEQLEDEEEEEEG